MAAIFNDLNFALRVYLKNSGLTLTAVVTLALGLGAATAIFTVVNSVLLQPLPYPYPERIVIISSVYRGGIDYGVTRAAQFRFLQERSQSFESLEVNDVVASGVNLSGGSEPEQAASAFVSSEFFRVIGVIPTIGRAFTENDGRSGGACAVMLTDGLWRRRYNGDRAIVGGTITLNGESCLVTGVLPPSFRFHVNAEILMPMRIASVPRDLGHYYTLLARLRPGVTLEQARAELQTIFSRFQAAHGDLVDQDEVGFQVESYLDGIVGNVRPVLWALFGAVFLVVLIACANVANLQLSLAARRGRELAVRTALGAGRMRLARQFVTESLLLSFTGGVCGLLLAQWGTPILLHLSPSGLPRATDISADLRVVAFAFLMSTLTALVFGVAPVLPTNREDVNIWLKSASSFTTAAPGPVRARRLLIGAEVALSVILLTGAILFMRSFVALRRVAPGFDPGNILTFKMSVPARYSTTRMMWEFERQLLARLDALPGVDAAASAICLPLEIGPYMPSAILGQSPPIAVNPAYRPVSPDYFHVLRIPLVRGRIFTDSDTSKSASVAIINDSFARQTFMDQDPVGQRIQPGAGLGIEEADSPRVIVGVVGDVRETSLEKPARITVFIPRAQVPDAETQIINRLLPMSWAVRTKIPPAQLATAVRRTILAVDSRQPAADMRTMEQAMSTAVDRQRFTLFLMTIFAFLAMMMSAVGIYGVVSYQVGQRERELGIRLALGAPPKSLARMVTRQELKPIAAGLLAGVFSALVLARLIRSLLFETSSHDPVTLAASVLALGTLASLGCYWPARRSSLVDPMKTLRDE